MRRWRLITVEKEQFLRAPRNDQGRVGDETPEAGRCRSAWKCLYQCGPRRHPRPFQIQAHRKTHLQFDPHPTS